MRYTTLKRRIAQDVVRNKFAKRKITIGSAMTPKEKLINWLINEKNINIPSDIMVNRTYAGRHQLAAGAYTSFFHSYENPTFEIGMYQPMSVLVKCPNLELTHDRNFGSFIECGCVGQCKGRAANTKENANLHLTTGKSQNAGKQV